MIASNMLQEATSSSYDWMVDNYLPDRFRFYIEQEFYGKVAEQARFELFTKDPEFQKDPMKHIALYTDHGIIHVRDVALQYVSVLNTVNGVLISKREKSDLEFLKAFGLQLVYLHDIGMADFSAYGRFMHPEVAAQFVFKAEFDEMLEYLWQANAGNIPWKIMRIFQSHCDTSQMKIIYREMLSLSVAHSKSKMPIQQLNDPQNLRKLMLDILSKPLPLTYCRQKKAKLEKQKLLKTEVQEIEKIEREIQDLQQQETKLLEQKALKYASFTERYTNFETEAFQWLERTEAIFRKLILDVQDVLRCVRAADALRQRGTVLRTSAGYEIFVDRKTANAIYALRNEKNDQLFLLEGKKSVNAGEANLASSELDAKGNLRVSFHTGAFSDKKIVKKAARNAANTIEDIQADVLQSFEQFSLADEDIYLAPSVSHQEVKIQIESTDDNPEFADLVIHNLAEINPSIQHRIEKTVSLQGADLIEVKRYNEGKDLKEALESIDFKEYFLENLTKANYKFSAKKPIPGLKDIKLIRVSAGDELIRSGSPSGFVYIPLSKGLRVYPLGGYESKSASAWIPIGNTGVIRGSVRNARVIAEKALELICIPKSIYLNYWYQPFSPNQLIKRLKK